MIVKEKKMDDIPRTHEGKSSIAVNSVSIGLKMCTTSKRTVVLHGNRKIMERNSILVGVIFGSLPLSFLVHSHRGSN